jgi:hypothetical protein
VNHAAKWVLMVGIVGAALLLGALAGLVATRGGPVAFVPSGTATAVPAAAATGDRYLLSPPNERDPGDDGSGGAAGGGHAALRAGTSSGLGQDGIAADCPARADRPAYRVSPPNETDPGP